MIGQEIADLAKKVYADRWGYIWGTSGQLWTQEAYDKMCAEKKDNSNYNYSIRYGAQWIGHHVADCSGLIVYICKQFGVSVPHGSNSIWKNSLETRSEILGDIPVGALVFKVRNGTDFYHVGVFVGGDTVIEAQGTKSGVVQSNISAWRFYGLLKDVDYSDNPSADDGESAEIKGIVDVPNDGSLNVRSKPSEKGAIVDKLREGDKVEVLANSAGWSKIRYTKEGYVMTRFLR